MDDGVARLPPAGGPGYRALRPVLRMVIGLLGAPGMPPFTISRLRSASTRTTSSPLLVTRRLPICPAIFSPLKTLPGVVPPPMEPGARERSDCPCVRGPPPKPCRFIVPAKPRPLERPLTSTISPRLKNVHRNQLPHFVAADVVRRHFLQTASNLAASQVARLRPVGAAHPPEAQLHRRVAIPLRRADLGDGARAGFNYRDRHYLPGVVEHLGHTDFLAEERLEHFLCLPVIICVGGLRRPVAAGHARPVDGVNGMEWNGAKRKAAVAGGHPHTDG